MDDTNQHPTELPPDGGLPLALGPKLASGRDADVYDLGSHRVLRRNRKGDSAEREAEILRHAVAHGYPAPAVYENRGPDLVMERLSGPTMLADVSARPWLFGRYARMLAVLHRRLAEIPPLDWLKPFPPDAAPGPRDCLLHLDLHPDNVILTTRGPVVIDWSSAKRGTVASAIALTWVIMATSQLPGPPLKRRLFDVLRRLLVAEFLRHVDRPAVLRALPAAARFRLADRNLLDSERPAIYDLARRAGVSL